jgi:hypothetical protein
VAAKLSIQIQVQKLTLFADCRPCRPTAKQSFNLECAFPSPQLGNEMNEANNSRVLSHFPYKYHVFTVEYAVLGAITSAATVMLAVTTVSAWRLAPKLRHFGIAACILELFYISIARY